MTATYDGRPIVVDPLLKVSNRVTVKRYRDGRQTMNITGVVVSVGEVGFRLSGQRIDGPIVNSPFDTHLAHDPTGRDVEHPVEQVIELA